MKLSEIKKELAGLECIAFKLPDGNLVPRHFHVTEIGKIAKKFIDCGGTLREETKISFQLWEANDYDHRLHPEKLLHIIELSEKVLELGDWEIEVEYQSSTIGKYDLDFDGADFLLINKATTCLAQEKCGVVEKPKKNLAELTTSCAPGSGCC
ncbi:DUF6428 family protein [Christiangramia flava]|uniref:Uncharacterized protein n=1 Tax=Christiangramia flava JLT2011 TaxID=1229726 RepID=A0A1L7I3Q5_9FLAO|nr:DUF6428 family protein [Christiangramia flava]APU67803.1 hypothetical protein GRFL_1079 [Christiangramia flava JLT2011]OSS40306.1 hypothetical protein C723_0614 [Christiangramia flava JLT2011]